MQSGVKRYRDSDEPANIVVAPAVRSPDVSTQEVEVRGKLIQEVLNAVDGSYANSKMTVENLINAKVRLTPGETNSIMASFLMERSDDVCLSKYGQGHGHAFLMQFNARPPRWSINQLHSIGLGKRFHDHFIVGLVTPPSMIDQTLYRLFCGLFGLESHWSIPEKTFAEVVQRQEQNIESLKEKIKANNLVIMAGIGVSLGIVNNRKLSWNGLLDEIRRMLNERASDPTHRISDTDWIGEPEAKAKRLDETVKKHYSYLDYRQFVSVAMRDIVPKIQHPLALALSNLGLPVATTNYDLVLEQTLLRFERNLADPPIRFSPQYHREFVYHVHGVWFDSNSVVLSNDDYVRTQYDFEYAIGKLFFDGAGESHRSLLFVASKMGLVDSHFSSLYKDPRFAHLQHFALLKNKDVEELTDNPNFSAAVAKRTLIPIIYGENNDELTNFLQRLKDD